jgi:hypothetical protein
MPGILILLIQEAVQRQSTKASTEETLQIATTSATNTLSQDQAIEAGQ